LYKKGAQMITATPTANAQPLIFIPLGNINGMVGAISQAGCFVAKAKPTATIANVQR
jgi:hypothetical protein